MSVTYRWTRTATIANGQVPSTQTNFPLLFSFTDNDFRSVGNGGHVQNANGYDLNIYTSTALTSILASDTERYVAATGESIKWAQGASVADATVYSYGFGDPSITTSQDAASTVWSAFLMVQHFPDGSSLTSPTPDATGNGNTGAITSATAAAGKIGGGAVLSTSAHIDVAHMAGIDAVGAVTYSEWLKPTTLADFAGIVSSGGTNFIVQTGGTNRGNNTRFESWFDSFNTTGTAMANGAWIHFAYVFDGSQTGDANRLKLYINGVLATQSYNSTVPTVTGTGAAFVFNLPLPRMAQTIDEAHLATSAFTANWIATEYNNQSAPGTFFTLAASTQIAIDFDAKSNSGYQTASSSYSWSHTCAGSNRYLRVSVSLLSVLGTTVSSITYNSVALTFLGGQQSAAGAARVEIWGLKAPAIGSNTIAVTLSAAVDSAAGADSWTYVNQVIPTEGFNSATATNGGAANATVNCTSAADLDMVLDAVATSDTAVTVVGGHVVSWNVTGALGSGAGATTGVITPAGATTMAWTDGAVKTWSIAAIALRPVSATSSWGGAISDAWNRAVYVPV